MECGGTLDWKPWGWVGWALELELVGRVWTPIRGTREIWGAAFGDEEPGNQGRTAEPGTR